MSAETQEQVNRRLRNGRIATILSIIWWVVSIGGIITVITLQSYN